MGALHAGHLALVRLARRRADRVIVSIFVNPAQFAPHEDLATYPRTFAADLAALSALAVDLVWAPTVDVMYPDDFTTRVVPAGPAAAGLEDAFRPHFFGGVATVVAKLFLQCRPTSRCSARRTISSSRWSRRWPGTSTSRSRVVPGRPCARRTASRCPRATPTSRRASAPLRRRSIACSTTAPPASATGKPIASTLARGRAAIERAGFAVDYLEARHAETLAPIRSPQDGPIRLLVAATLGKTRLIDNVGV